MKKLKFCKECAKQMKKEKKPKRVAKRWIDRKFVCDACCYRIRRKGGNGKDNRDIKEVHKNFVRL